MIVLKDQGEAEKAAIVISGVINPALDGLKMYRTIGSRTFTKEDEIEADIYYKIDRARSSDHFPTATVFQHPFNSHQQYFLLDWFLNIIHGSKFKSP